MHPTESIQQFYARVLKADAAAVEVNNAGSGHFNVFPRSDCSGKTPFGRRDFYKVSLMLGTGRVYYADRCLELEQPTLLFNNPMVPYSWEAVSKEQSGWYCLFTDAFVHPWEKKELLQDCPIFQPGEMPAFFLNPAQQEEIAGIFRKMMEEMASGYSHKFDLLRTYLHLIIHLAMKMQPARHPEKNPNASARLTQQFMELLERQFPIESSETILNLRTANHYAEHLSVHVNHLNRALKEVTGKTTTEHISARIVKEAMGLLRHSDWNVSQIAYGLGFDYPAYFNIFFKKQTGLTPKEVRRVLV